MYTCIAMLIFIFGGDDDGCDDDGGGGDGGGGDGMVMMVVMMVAVVAVVMVILFPLAALATQQVEAPTAARAKVAPAPVRTSGSSHRHRAKAAPAPVRTSGSSHRHGLPPAAVRTAKAWRLARPSVSPPSRASPGNTNYVRGA